MDKALGTQAGMKTHPPDRCSVKVEDSERLSHVAAHVEECSCGCGKQTCWDYWLTEVCRQAGVQRPSETEEAVWRLGVSSA